MPSTRIIVPSNGPITLKKTGAAVTVAGTLTETVLATIALPALAPNAQLWLYIDCSNNNNANLKRITQRINGTSMSSYTVTTSATFSMLQKFVNRGATNSQIVTPGAATTAFSSSSGSFLTRTLDLSAPSTFTLSGLLVDVGDSLTLETYVMELRT